MIGLVMLPDTLYSPPSVERPPIIQKLTEKELLIFKNDREKLAWCDGKFDCKVLAEAIAYEARSESEAGKVSVAHTILNRVKDRRWGNSIKKVVYQRAQFSYTGTQIQKTKPSSADWKSAKLLAFEVLNGLVGSPVKDATHYHTVDVSPNWANRLEYVVTIGRHIFYR